MTKAPTVRLALGGTGRHRAFHEFPTRLEYFNTPATQNSPNTPVREPPSVLISFVYLQGFLKKRRDYHITDWALDSGAFSAHNSGTEIRLDEYIETCKHLMKTDDQLTDIFSLDVIGDWRASQENTDVMWNAGVPAIPCYHIGEPEKVLIDLAKRHPKIALGGVAKLKGKKKLEWTSQCFARVYPKKIHGFGYATRDAVMGLPFHSTDATSWELRPAKFGSWPSYDGLNLRIRGSKHDLRTEVNFFLELQRDARSRWKTEMTKLENLDNEQ